ncbi:MAG TPA: fumarylacetoacetate hydrolase family protein [Acetobacteraceae bacterium]
MSHYDPGPAAAALHRVRLDRGIVRPLPASIAPRTEADGAAAQHALAVLTGEARPAGFKIGATGKRMQEYLGLHGPAAGFMAAPNVHRASADLRFADYIRPGVECEVAVRLARDLPPGPCTPAEAAAAVGTFTAGIEIVENRYDDIATLGTPTLIADQVYHCAAVIGEPAAADWHGLDTGALRGRITVAGGAEDEGVTTDLMGHPFNCLAWLAGSSVAAAFGGLKAGQFVMLGSVVPPIWLAGPAHVTVAFESLPAVNVRLA